VCQAGFEPATTGSVPRLGFEPKPPKWMSFH
jgi:hypothetical protein